ncbi:hypothetical protein Tco_0774786 [Tanacetum coccineum]|uniref:Uncharacterized protein n=1 Tax=Tanacetum coccineum TaxID=301880 RepID=A0ABQ4ZQC9_9ASTR
MNGGGIGTEGPLRARPLQVVMAFNSPFGLATGVSGEFPYPIEEDCLRDDISGFIRSDRTRYDFIRLWRKVSNHCGGRSYFSDEIIALFGAPFHKGPASSSIDGITMP